MRGKAVMHPAWIARRKSIWKTVRKRGNMINFNNKKNKKILTAVIIIFLVVAMVVPMVASALLSFR